VKVAAGREVLDVVEGDVAVVIEVEDYLQIADLARRHVRDDESAEAVQLAVC
jgi:hypothetical protein